MKKERNDNIAAHELETGDVFYKLSDKTRVAYRVTETVNGIMYKKEKDLFVKELKDRSQRVVFLRNLHRK